MTDRYSARAREIIYKEFNQRDNLQCIHCDRQFDDSMCDTCFKKRLHSLVAQALQEVEAETRLQCAIERGHFEVKAEIATAKRCLAMVEKMEKTWMEIEEQPRCVLEAFDFATAIKKEFNL